jgi:hypothetical protein
LAKLLRRLRGACAGVAQDVERLIGRFPARRHERDRIKLIQRHQRDPFGVRGRVLTRRPNVEKLQGRFLRSVPCQL